MVGMAKQNQLKHWSNYFLHTKEVGKNSIRITKVMQDLTEIPPRERKHRSDSVWTDHISIQLHHSLATLTDSLEPNKYGIKTLVLSTQEAFEEVGLVNSEFKKLSWNVTPKTPITESIIFARAAGDKLYRILYNVLFGLHNKHILHVDDTYVVYESERSKSLRLATGQEKVAIHLAMEPLLEGPYCTEKGKGTKYNVNLRGLNKPFYDDLKEILAPKGIFFGHKVYDISFSDTSLASYKKFLRNDNEIAYSKGIINKASYEALKKIIEDDINKLPPGKDLRTLDDFAAMVDLDKTEYFELLNYSVPLFIEDEEPNAQHL